MFTPRICIKMDRPVSCVSGGIAAKGLAFSHGYELYFEEATVLFDAGTLAGEWIVSRPLSVITNDGKMASPESQPTGNGVMRLPMNCRSP